MSKQFNLFGEEVSEAPQPGKPLRIQDKLRLARAEGKTLIRLEGWSGSPTWIIKTITENGAGGWKHLEKHTDAEVAKSRYNELLNSGKYAEG
ncbi:hypothetical protein [uncultured Fibrella sp.]|uniref:hypothetical protein n=1 Tax=uncultured Fibrella sp. TaxID=1284596 RepID=UPI0035CB6073